MTVPRVLLCGRHDLFTKPGGDTRQLLGLQHHLGPSATLSLELRPRLDGVDLVHVFNLSRPLEPAVQSEHARRQGTRVVCTPIYQDLGEYNRRGRRGAGRILFHLLGCDDDRMETARALVNLLRGGIHVAREGAALLTRAAAAGGARGLQGRILENSAALVFNSSLEEAAVSRVSAPRGPGRNAVVPVGIDGDEFPPDPRPFLRLFGLDAGFVLSVGRFEDLKNQLGLIEALEDEPLSLVLIGDVNPMHRTYARAVFRAANARPRTYILAGLSRPLLLSAMAAAAVHAQPSWFETAGLASLEAAASGCAIVSTDRGYARAFLEQDASYCDPGDPASIRHAVHRALALGPSEQLRGRILDRFTLSRAATALAAIYERVAA